MFSFIDYAGVVGCVAILWAFWRASSGKWQGTSWQFQLANLIGALLLGVYSVYKEAYVNLALNIVWSVVAVHGLLKVSQAVRTHSKAVKNPKQKTQVK